MKIEIEIGDHVIHELSVAVAAAAMDLLIPRLAAHLATLSLPAPVAQVMPAESSVTSTVITMKQVQKLTGLGRSTIWRLVSDRRFPAKVKLSSGRVGWIESEVLQWIVSHKSA